MVQPNADGTFDSDSNEYEDLEGYQYAVVVGTIGTVYEGPDILQAEEKYAEWVAKIGKIGAKRSPVASGELLKRWEGSTARWASPRL